MLPDEKGNETDKKDGDPVPRKEGGNMNTCGECYWYCDITVRMCDREKEPTSEEQEACPLFEPKEK